MSHYSLHWFSSCLSGRAWSVTVGVVLVLELYARIMTSVLGLASLTYRVLSGITITPDEDGANL